MARLGMDKTVQQPPAGHSACADAGADRDIDKVVESGCSAPEVFAQTGPVRVGIKADRHVAKCPRDRPDQVGIGPARFGRRCDVAVMGRAADKVHRAERCDPDGGQRLLPLFFPEPLDDPAITRPGSSPVANTSRFHGCRTSSGPRPTAQINLVPPASIPPTTRSLRWLTIGRLPVIIVRSHAFHRNRSALAGGPPRHFIDRHRTGDGRSSATNRRQVHPTLPICEGLTNIPGTRNPASSPNLLIMQGA